MGRYQGGFFESLSALWHWPYRRATLLELSVKRCPADEMSLGALGWRDFEKLIGAGFQQRGFHVLQRPGDAAPPGAELLVSRRSERFFVQCKHWQARKVDVRVVREAHGMMAAEQLAGGFVVTLGTFTKNAHTFAAARRIELIDGKCLTALLQDGRRWVAEVIFAGAAANGPETAPYCPACLTPMIVRAAKRGARTGSFFWACAQFPACRQTMVMWSEGRRSA